MGTARRAATVAGAVRATPGKHSLPDRLKAVLPMLKDSLAGRWQRAPRGRLLLSLAGIGYVLSPLDLMPEVLLGPFGLGDDLAIALVCAASLLNAADSWLDDQAGGTGPDPDVVQGEVINRTETR